MKKRKTSHVLLQVEDVKTNQAATQPNNVVRRYLKIKCISNTYSKDEQPTILVKWKDSVRCLHLLLCKHCTSTKSSHGDLIGKIHPWWPNWLPSLTQRKKHLATQRFSTLNRFVWDDRKMWKMACPNPKFQSFVRNLYKAQPSCKNPWISIASLHFSGQMTINFYKNLNAPGQFWWDFPDQQNLGLPGARRWMTRCQNLHLPNNARRCFAIKRKLHEKNTPNRSLPSRKLTYPTWGKGKSSSKYVFMYQYMGVSKNRGTPKSSIFIGVFNYFHHPFWGAPTWWFNPWPFWDGEFTWPELKGWIVTGSTIGDEKGKAWVTWPPKFNMFAPEKWCLEDAAFLLGWVYFEGAGC